MLVSVFSTIKSRVSTIKSLDGVLVFSDRFVFLLSCLVALVLHWLASGSTCRGGLVPREPF